MAIAGISKSIKYFKGAKSETIFGNWKPFKNYEKRFLFHLKNSFRSQDIWVFANFLIMYKNGLIRNIRLFLEFMTSQPGYQTVAMYILPNISRSKGNQTMKFGQLTECNLRNIFVEKSYTKYAAETIARPLSKISKLSISLDW